MTLVEIEPAAEPDFKQHNIGRVAREQKKCSGGVNLEYGDRLAGVDALTLFECGDQFRVRRQPPGETKALVEAHEMRRGVDMDAQAGGLEHGAQKRNGRALPLVPATWMTGAMRRSGLPSAASRRCMRSSERSMRR